MLLSDTLLMMLEKLLASKLIKSDAVSLHDLNRNPNLGYIRKIYIIATTVLQLVPECPVHT